MHPHNSQLSTLEERFVSARIPFMKIQELPVSHQYKLSGRAVNILNDIIDNNINI